MKRRAVSLLCAIALMISGWNGVPTEAARKPVSLSKTKMTLAAGKSKTITVKSASRVIIKKKTFRSSNRAVATVTKTGKVVAKKLGKQLSKRQSGT